MSLMFLATLTILIDEVDRRAKKDIRVKINTTKDQQRYHITLINLSNHSWFTTKPRF